MPFVTIARDLCHGSPGFSGQPQDRPLKPGALLGRRAARLLETIYGMFRNIARRIVPGPDLL